MFFLKTTSILVRRSGGTLTRIYIIDENLTLAISEDDKITRTILHVAKENIVSEQFRKITQSKFSIRFISHPWRRITTSSFLLEEYPLERDHLNNVLIIEELLIFIKIFDCFIHSTLLKTPSIFNFTEREGMLSSRCILNMKRLATRRYKLRKTLKASSGSNLEVC